VKIVKTDAIEWLSQASPSGKFARSARKISEALGRDRHSTDLNERHPFDVEITKIPPGAASCPFHSHSAQWEFFHVISGHGTLRHRDGTIAIESGDALFSSRTNRTNSSMRAPKTSSSTSSRTIPSANLAIIPTVTNGRSSLPNIGSFAASRWTTTTAKTNPYQRVVSDVPDPRAPFERRPGIAVSGEACAKSAGP